jgi:hypothetical protein
VSSEPVRFRDPAALAEWLKVNGIPYESWGVGGSKSFDRLWREISEGETTLREGPPRRWTEVVSVSIRVGGRQLVEVRQRMADGTVRERNLPPSEKMLPREAPVRAAYRCLMEELGVECSAVMSMVESEPEPVKEGESPSYPGLTTSYRVHNFTAEVVGLNPENFTTKEGLLTHYWEWR